MPRDADDMTPAMRLRWAPKVRPDRIRRLYELEAQGLLSDEVLDKVGWALWARCDSILTVSRECARCPACGAVVSGAWHAQSHSASAACARCARRRHGRRSAAAWRCWMGWSRRPRS
jgi:hypothetical protein